MTTQIAARAYTLAEIDEMRYNVRTLMTGPGFKYDPAQVEDRLRTYMMAGIGPADMEAAVAEQLEENRTRAARYLAKRGIVSDRNVTLLPTLYEARLALNERLDAFKEKHKL